MFMYGFFLVIYAPTKQNYADFYSVEEVIFGGAVSISIAALLV